MDVYRLASTQPSVPAEGGGGEAARRFSFRSSRDPFQLRLSTLTIACSRSTLLPETLNLSGYYLVAISIPVGMT